jgi:hypothetical protein
MRTTDSRVFASLRYRYKQFKGIDTSKYKSIDLIDLHGEEISKAIFDAIESGKPFMLSRFGSEEIKWYVQYKVLSRSLPVRIWKYISCQSETWERDGRVIDNLTFKPRSLEGTQYFIAQMDKAIPQIDLLGSWLKLEQSKYVFPKLSCRFAFLVDIEPYYHQEPWSRALSRKKVLVIHPMEDSILRQYAKRKFLFNDERVLPDFELITLKAKYFDDPHFDSWSKIYHFYLDEIVKIDFDVALIGCGSWGMPLAAEIKLMGKVALHLGGATQNLFGIIGKRWEELYPEFTSKFFNDHWERPMVNEVPRWAEKYDGKAYW